MITQTPKRHISVVMNNTPSISLCLKMVANQLVCIYKPLTQGSSSTDTVHWVFRAEFVHSKDLPTMQCCTALPCPTLIQAPLYSFFPKILKNWKVNSSGKKFLRINLKTTWFSFGRLPFYSTLSKATFFMQDKSHDVCNYSNESMRQAETHHTIEVSLSENMVKISELFWIFLKIFRKFSKIQNCIRNSF